MNAHDTTGTQLAPRRAPQHPHPAEGGLVGVASEQPWHRRHSPIGGSQRHYTLEPVLWTADAVCGDGVVVVIGLKAGYAFPADAEGHIADYRPVAEVPGARDDAAVLVLLGYSVAADPDWSF